MNLLGAWRAWHAEAAPFGLESDLGVLLREEWRPHVVVHRSWHEVVGAPDYGEPGDTRLHLGLLPQPFCGDVERASVYVLLLNPGLGPSDYYGEHEVPEYRERLIRNLKPSPGDRPTFLFLDPRFSWHGGYRWWHGKLAGVIGRLADSWRVPFSEARRRLARSMASIEMVPYHSEKFRDRGRCLRELESARLARAFVEQFVLPRVETRHAIVVVTRKAREWGLPDLPGVVNYTAGQARAAHLTPESPGGRAILEHLARDRHRG